MLVREKVVLMRLSCCFSEEDSCLNEGKSCFNEEKYCVSEGESCFDEVELLF